MDHSSLLAVNLLSPMVLCFALGALARFLKSDLSLPESVYTAMATYLLLAIGLKGGVALSETNPATVALPALATLLLGVSIPVLVYYVARLVGKIDDADAGALAAHYGSVSAVTFIASLSFLDSVHVKHEGYMPALVAIMEIPAIVVGLLLARKSLGRGGTIRAAVHEILTGKSVVLLAGGMLIGALTGTGGYEKVQDFFSKPFQGILCLFMLDMGLLAAGRLSGLQKTGVFLAIFALVAPVVNGSLGLLAAHACGMSLGGATILAAMTASASYIAAPTAVRLALPQANPALYLTTSVGITFPFNLAFGIPLYFTMAKMLYGGG